MIIWELARESTSHRLSPPSLEFSPASPASQAPFACRFPFTAFLNIWCASNSTTRRRSGRCSRPTAGAGDFREQPPFLALPLPFRQRLMPLPAVLQGMDPPHFAKRGADQRDDQPCLTYHVISLLVAARGRRSVSSSAWSSRATARLRLARAPRTDSAPGSLRLPALARHTKLKR